MRVRIGKVSEVVRELFREAKGAARPARPSTRLGLETLEDRLVLSGNLPALTPPQGINLVVPGDAYVLAGASEPTDYTAMTKWAQPGGLGTPVTITYSYSNVLGGQLGGLSAATVKAAIQEALADWASAAPIRFVEVPDSGPAISTTDYTKGSTPTIRFGSLAIDGPYNTLGYGYYPGGAGLSGDVVFDSSEHWTTNPATGVDLVEVAEHEIGHALALAHEPPPSAGGLQAVMNPYYAGAFHGLGTSHLFADDINGIRALYGQGVGSVTPYSPTPVTPTPVTPVTPKPLTPPPVKPTSITPVQTGFSLSGTTLYITGTAGADSVIFSGAGVGSVSLDGVSYAGSLASVRSIVIDTGAGQDTVSVTGSSAAETFALKPDALTMTGPKWNVTAVNAESIQVTGGAEDSVSFQGAAGANTFTASATQASLTGTGYSLVSKGIGSVTAQTVHGGNDTARLYGSAAVNYFVSTPSTARLYGSGYSITATNFQTVYAYSSGRGDSATLGGSAAGSTVVANATSTSVQAADGSSTVVAAGFANVVVNAVGGTNRATLTAGTGVDTLVVSAAATTLSGAGYSIRVNGFGNVAVTNAGGRDQVWIYDSTGKAAVTVAGSTATVSYPAARVQLTGFASASVFNTSAGVDKKKVGSTSMGLSFWGFWA